jgi:hypothetical protein
MNDDLMKLMGWLEVRPIDPDLFEAATGIAPKVQIAIKNLQSTSFHSPAPVNVTGRITRFSGQAATAPGSVRRGSDHWSSWTSWDDRGSWTWAQTYQHFSELTQRYINSIINPGRKVTAASELEDEPAQPGFQATGPRDDFAGHMAYHGYKPGTPEWDEAARAWVQREQWKRVQSGELDRASRLAVRDAHLERYKQSDADRLIEEMMQ